MMTYDIKVGDQVEYVGNTRGLPMNRDVLGEIFSIISINGDGYDYWVYGTNGKHYRAYNLALAAKPYDTNQIGDTQDDI